MPADLQVTDSSGQRTLSLAGRLDADGVAAVWQPAHEALRAKPQAKQVKLDASEVAYCDGAGIALLFDLMHSRDGAKVELAGLAPEFRTLLEQFDRDDFQAHAPPPSKQENMFARSTIFAGRLMARVFDQARTEIAFLGETGAALALAVRSPHEIRWREVLLIAERAGVDALPIVALISFLFGAILAFQSAIPMKMFGAELFVADLVGLAVLRELAPLMTAILFAGRSGAAFAAELGTMKVNEEINALTTMGLDPVRFLVVPRLIAALLVAPLLTIFADMIGLIGGAFAMLSFAIPTVTYFNELKTIVDLGDFASGFVKSFAFGVLIAGIGCMRGLQTKSGAAAVGESTTRAVVSSIVMIVVVDGFFAFAYYVLDI